MRLLGLLQGISQALRPHLAGHTSLHNNRSHQYFKLLVHDIQSSYSILHIPAVICARGSRIATWALLGRVRPSMLCELLGQSH